MPVITFEKLLPSLVALTGSLVAAWLLFRGLAKLIRYSAHRTAPDEPPAAAERWARNVTSFLRRAISVAALLISVLILLYGVGIEGLPRLTWEKIASWTNDYVIPVAFILGSGYIIIQFINLFISRLPDYLSGSAQNLLEKAERRKRAESAGRLLRWVTTSLVLAVTGLMALRKVGVDITPLLTGSAVIGVALGFGAQDLVKDIISGFFLIVENQIRVGDVVEVNGKGGLVEELRIRTIVLRGQDGTVHIIPNGGIREVSNRTKDFSYYVIDLGVAYKENVDDVIATLHDIGAELQRDPVFGPKILDRLDVLGVDDFADSAVMIKMRIRTVPLEQWNVGRELRRRIKIVFDELGIEIPYPHVSVYAGSAMERFPVSISRDRSRRESGPAGIAEGVTRDGHSPDRAG